MKAKQKKQKNEPKSYVEKKNKTGKNNEHDRIKHKKKDTEKSIPSSSEAHTEFSAVPIWNFLQKNEEVHELINISSRIAQWAEDLIPANDIHFELATNAIPSIQKIKDKVEKMEDRFIDSIEQQIELYKYDIKNIKEFFSGIMGPLDEAEQILEDKTARHQSSEETKEKSINPLEN